VPQWSFKETEEQVQDRLILRWFCRVSFERVPNDTTLVRWLQTIRAETLHALNERVVELAKQANVSTGRTRRLDAPCVQTGIPHPTDSVLVLFCMVKRANALVQAQGTSARQHCRSRLRIARRTGEDTEAEQKKRSEKRIETTEQRVCQAKKVGHVLSGESEKLAERLVHQAEEVLPLAERVITHTRRRVLEQKKVATAEHMVRMCEPHTRAIPRHTGGALVKFGRYVIEDDVEGGVVTRSQILEHPTEHSQAGAVGEHHQKIVARPPRLGAGDRGVHSPDTEDMLTASGVTRIAMLASGIRSAARQMLERARAFRRSADTRGRVASVRPGAGWRTSRSHRMDGIERWVGLGVMARNLHLIAQFTRGDHCNQSKESSTQQKRTRSFMNCCVSIALSVRFCHVAGDTSTREQLPPPIYRISPLS
jgi:IS5 family transposase